MQFEIASVPARPELRLSGAGAARLLLPATILVTLLFELVLAERKYALFGGGFGQSRTLDTPVELLAFVLPLLACQGLLFYLLYRLLRRLHGRKAASWLFPFNFAGLIGLGALGAIVAQS